MKTTATPSEALSGKKKLLNRRDLVAYFLVAGTGAAVQLVAGAFLRNYMGFNAAVALGYLISFFVGFILTKLFAFDAKRSGQTNREMIKFSLVALLSWLVTVGGARLALDLFNSRHPQPLVLHLPLDFLKPETRSINVKELSAQLMGMGGSFVLNYVLHKTFTFRSTGFYDRIRGYLKDIPE